MQEIEPVSLTQAQRDELLRLSKSQRHSERKHARIPLLADETKKAAQTKTTPLLSKSRCALDRYPRSPALRRAQPTQKPGSQGTRKARVLNGEAEAFLVALTCSTPPEGQKRWSLRLLKDALIEQHIADAIGQETVRQRLKKTH